MEKSKEIIILSLEVIIEDPNKKRVFLTQSFYEGSPLTSLPGKNKRPMADFDLLFEINEDNKSIEFIKDYKELTSYGEPRAYLSNYWNQLKEAQDPHKNKKSGTTGGGGGRRPKKR